MRSCKGFTLVEMLVVLMLLGIMAAAAVPSFTSGRQSPESSAVEAIIDVLSNARAVARESGARAEVVISPRDARYWTATGNGVRTGKFLLPASIHLVGTDSARVICAFSATGPSTPCAIAVRGARDVIVRVDPWTGAIVTGDRER